MAIEHTLYRQKSATWDNFQQRWIFRVCLTSMGLIPRSLLDFLRYVHSSLAASQLPSMVSSLSAWFISYVAARPVSECNRFSHGSRWTEILILLLTEQTECWGGSCSTVSILGCSACMYIYVSLYPSMHMTLRLFYRLMAVAILVTVRPAIDELSRDLLM